MTERHIDESLERLSRRRVSISIEDRVMAMVRQEAALQRERARVGSRHRAILGGALTAGIAVESAAVAAGAMVLLPSLRVLGRMLLERPIGSAVESVRPALAFLMSIVHAFAVLDRAIASVVRGLLLFAPSPIVLAAIFMTGVLSLTFYAVRRDQRRATATARGLR
jgi:Arc/MetJ family transcription regulator